VTATATATTIAANLRIPSFYLILSGDTGF
jgi:hypothetical protein